MNDPHDCPPDDDLRIANRVMLEGDLPHAALHVARALHLDHFNQEALALADEIFHLSEDPLALVPLKEEPFLCDVVLRARFLQLANLHNEALVLINTIIYYEKEIGFVEWAISLLLALKEKVRLDLFLHVLSNIWKLYCSKNLTPQDHEQINRLVGIVLNLEKHFENNAKFLAHGSIFFRRSENLDLALDWGLRSFDLDPNFFHALVVANAYKGLDDARETIRWFGIAAEKEESGCSALVELGDYLSALSLYEDAINFYSEALQKEPENDWAIPSLYYAKSRGSSPETRLWKAKLALYAAEHPDNDQAARLNELNQPWILYLPEPADATLKKLKKLLAEKKN